MKRWACLVATTGVGIKVASLDRSKENEAKRSLEQKIRRAEDIVRKFKEERGVPGMSVGVSLNGLKIWLEGFGYSDVENLTPCHQASVMRIASISKPLTMTLAAKLVEEGKLDLDAPIQKYVPSFPEKVVDGEKVVLTTRHLISHLGGVRHYAKKNDEEEKLTDKTSSNGKSEKAPVKESKELRANNAEQMHNEENVCTKCKRKVGKKSEFQLQEYYNQKMYESVVSALHMFKNDDLFSKPGTKFLYTTHGWTLVSAVVEAAGSGKFEHMMTDMFGEFNMRDTRLDENLPLIANRSKFYRRSRKTGLLENVPCVDNSYKWAGGGVLSTVGDLLTFADVLLLAYRRKPPEDARTQEEDGVFLKRETVQLLWTPVPNTECNWASRKASYGMGWCVAPSPTFARRRDTSPFYVSHTGGAVGASCVLLIKPIERLRDVDEQTPLLGLSVAVLTNLQECGGLNKLALDIAEVFDDVL